MYTHQLRVRCASLVQKYYATNMATVKTMYSPHLKAQSKQNSIISRPLKPPKYEKIMAFLAAIMGLGLSFYILLGSRQGKIAIGS